MRMFRTWMLVLVALIASSSPAGAQTVQKCRAPDGTVRYQSAACAPGERVLATWDAEPDPATPVAAPSMPTRAMSTAPRRGRTAYRRAAARADVDPCRAAKERRDAVERRVGLARTYELLSALQRDVYDACR
ncbi:DUF4124 domain-containing protein [Lysobacter sp. N42]|uniref:DUF4124 domain-containing protein n=1 Tax=Lysobacter sp. N42 TaxID=2545719 RepID=UPI0010492D02|nr:DUF4124 domain-containing protein [Lysobacter sp. N42]TCZ88338.1 DUF4124 domain-containing protein [Lysobacter sp. N42]